MKRGAYRNTAPILILRAVLLLMMCSLSAMLWGCDDESTTLCAEAPNGDCASPDMGGGVPDDRSQLYPLDRDAWDPPVCPEDPQDPGTAECSQDQLLELDGHTGEVSQPPQNWILWFTSADARGTVLVLEGDAIEVELAFDLVGGSPTLDISVIGNLSQETLLQVAQWTQLQVPRNRDGNRVASVAMMDDCLGLWAPGPNGEPVGELDGACGLQDLLGPLQLAQIRWSPTGGFPRGPYSL